MKNKKAELTTQEIMELVLAAAGIFILIFLFWNLIAPTWNKETETAKSYLSMAEKAFSDADSGNIGEIYMLSTAKEPKYFLVYFGDRFTYEASSSLGTKMNFFNDKQYKNNLCVCIYKKDEQTKCSICSSLKYTFQLANLASTLGFVFEQDRTYYIAKTKSNEYIQSGIRDLLVSEEVT